MAKLSWEKNKYRGRPTEPAIPKPKAKPKGAWTHIKREPVRAFSRDEIALWQATNRNDGLS